MAVTSNMFDTIHPSLDFVQPVRNPDTSSRLLHSEFVRVTILDSDDLYGTLPVVAAVVIPPGRDNDWVFTTRSGYKRLREIYNNISRLFLVSNDTSHGMEGIYRLKEKEEDDEIENVKAEIIVCTVVSAYLPRSLKSSNHRFALLDPAIRYSGYGGPVEYYMDELVFRGQVMSHTVDSMNTLGNFIVQDEVNHIDGSSISFSSS
ncbi:hypothetical protein QVD17_36254 [Tagetes erecta]|uniref:Uncharacterized protein n=1 Tax=Tagetes erecta TaxID=13708 RepID=A0AAD8NBQ9_TARER|nr:hypothetical protein QVD17_36254 [Tagetes erecta]